MKPLIHPAFPVGLCRLLSLFLGIIVQVALPGNDGAQSGRLDLIQHGQSPLDANRQQQIVIVQQTDPFCPGQRKCAVPVAVAPHILLIFYIPEIQYVAHFPHHPLCFRVCRRIVVDHQNIVGFGRRSLFQRAFQRLFQ